MVREQGVPKESFALRDKIRKMKNIGQRKPGFVVISVMHPATRDSSVTALFLTVATLMKSPPRALFMSLFLRL